MKKFNFSLEKLLGYRNQVLDREKNLLSQLRRQRQELLDEEDQVAALYRAVNDKFTLDCAAGMTRQALTAAKQYINVLSDRLRELSAKIEAFDKRVEQQLNVVVEATKEVSALDKLKEHQLEEYNRLEQKEQETFVEEFVVAAAFGGK